MGCLYIKQVQKLNPEIWSISLRPIEKIMHKKLWSISQKTKFFININQDFVKTIQLNMHILFVYAWHWTDKKLCKRFWFPSFFVTGMDLINLYTKGICHRKLQNSRECLLLVFQLNQLLGLNLTCEIENFDSMLKINFLMLLISTVWYHKELF